MVYKQGRILLSEGISKERIKYTGHESRAAYSPATVSEEYRDSPDAANMQT